jgi:hypothetical protein
MPNPSHNTPEAAPQAAAYQPYIPASATLREFTPRALILGALLGMVFGASSLYLVLKVGMTVSASIPVAVIFLTLFRMWSRLGGRAATTLENNSDSYNDTGMLIEANSGFLIHAPENVKREFPQLKAVESHAELLKLIKEALSL